MSDTTSGKKRKSERQRVTTSDNELQRLTILVKLSFFGKYGVDIND